MEYNFEAFVNDEEKYFDYLEEVKDKINPRLLKLFMEEYSGKKPNRFHDSVIKNVLITADSQFYNKTSDSIELILQLGKSIEFHLKFSEIMEFKCDFFNSKISWSDNLIFGEIIDCIIGISERGYQCFEFFTDTEMNCIIGFNKISVKKLKMIH